MSKRNKVEATQAPSPQSASGSATPESAVPTSVPSTLPMVDVSSPENWNGDLYHGLSTPEPSATSPEATLPDLAAQPDCAAAKLKATEVAFCIWIPVGEINPGYRTTHIDVQLSERQAEAARYLFDALDQSGGRLAPAIGEKVGRSVKSTADAVRWVMDRIADEIEKLNDHAIDNPAADR